MAKSEGRMVRHTMITAAMTALSRVLGYVRDRVVADLLGTSYWADAFYIAFRVPNTFRRFVAEGAMNASFVPVLSGAFKEDGEASAWLFARRFLYVFGTFLALFGAAGSLAAPAIVRAMAWEFAGKAPEVYERCQHLTALLFPYITLVSLSAIAMGILNCRDVFGPPAFTPVLLNLSMVAAGLWWGRGANNPTDALAWGVLVGGALQFLFQVPYLKKVGMSLAPAFSLRDPRVRKVFALMVPGMLGAGVGQFTVLVGTAMAHVLGEGAVSALYYANRVTELAFGIFAVSISQVILPRMSMQVKAGDRAELESTLSQSLSMVFFELLPATAGILALSRPIVEVLFQTGRFNAQSVALTEGPLVAYTAGMVASGVALILVKVCHAHQDMMTPFYAGLGVLGSYVVLSLALMPSLGATGIALASSLSAVVNIAWVAWALRRKHGVPIPWKKLGRSFGQAAALSAAMGAGAWGIYTSLPHGTMAEKATALFASIGAGIALYAGAAFAMDIPHVQPFKEWWRRRRGSS
jgi:putative peptidoglycan lipid II flippase